MRSLPQGVGLIQVIGIGGIGLSGIAEELHNHGYQVQGSDVAEGGNTRRLAELGIKVMIGHRADNLGAAEVVVMSSAIKPDNPEIDRQEARAARAGRAAGRDARRIDAPQMGDRGRRDARQDHDDLDDRRAARNGAARPDRHQWRHHQCLRHEREARRWRLDGGRGRRERRHLYVAAGGDRRGSPISTQSISTITAISPRCSRPSKRSPATFRSTASPSCASTIRSCRA